MLNTAVDVVTNGVLSVVYLRWFACCGPFPHVPANIQGIAQIVATLSRMIIGRYDFSQTEVKRTFFTWTFMLCITSVVMLVLYPKGRAVSALRSTILCAVVLSLPQMAAHLGSRVLLCGTSSRSA